MSGRKVNGDNEPAPPKNYLREWREHRKLSQAEVQRRLGWNRGMVHNIEAKRTLVTETILFEFAQLYECSVGDLYKKPGELPTVPDPPRPSALHDVLPILAQIAKNAEALRDDLGGRIDALEAELAVAREKVNEAIRESADLHDALQRAADILFPAPKNGTPPEAA